MIEVCLQRGDTRLGARKQRPFPGGDTFQAGSDKSPLLAEIG